MAGASYFCNHVQSHSVSLHPPDTGKEEYSPMLVCTAFSVAGHHWPDSVPQGHHWFKWVEGRRKWGTRKGMISCSLEQRKRVLGKCACLGRAVSVTRIPVLTMVGDNTAFHLLVPLHHPHACCFASAQRRLRFIVREGVWGRWGAWWFRCLIVGAVHLQYLLWWLSLDSALGEAASSPARAELALRILPSPANEGDLRIGHLISLETPSGIKPAILLHKWSLTLSHPRTIFQVHMACGISPSQVLVSQCLTGRAPLCLCKMDW